MKALLHICWAGLLSASLAASANADAVSDALFVEGLFTALSDDQAITYAHDRKGAKAADFKEVTDGHIMLRLDTTTDGDRKLTMTLESDGKKPEMLDFPAGGGNPVLLVFLESTVRSMASITGGSPFYIQNRIKDSLRSTIIPRPSSITFAGRSIEAQEFTLQPFVQDPNRDRMGAFASLTLSFLVSDQVPGHFLHLSAEIPGEASSYTERITLIDGTSAP